MPFRWRSHVIACPLTLESGVMFDLLPSARIQHTGTNRIISIITSTLVYINILLNIFRILIRTCKVHLLIKNTETILYFIFSPYFCWRFWWIGVSLLLMLTSKRKQANRKSNIVIAERLRRKHIQLINACCCRSFCLFACCGILSFINMSIWLKITFNNAFNVETYFSPRKYHGTSMADKQTNHVERNEW